MKPNNIRELVNMMGVKQTAESLHCGQTLIRDALRNDKVTPVYEIAAARILDCNSEILTIETPDDFRTAIREYFEGKNLATLPPADFNFYLASIASIVHEPE